MEIESMNKEGNNDLNIGGSTTTAHHHQYHHPQSCYTSTETPTLTNQQQQQQQEDFQANGSAVQGLLFQRTTTTTNQEQICNNQKNNYLDPLPPFMRTKSESVAGISSSSSSVVTKNSIRIPITLATAVVAKEPIPLNEISSSNNNNNNNIITFPLQQSQNATLNSSSKYQQQPSNNTIRLKSRSAIVETQSASNFNMNGTDNNTETPESRSRVCSFSCISSSNTNNNTINGNSSISRNVLRLGNGIAGISSSSMQNLMQDSPSNRVSQQAATSKEVLLIPGDIIIDEEFILDESIEEIQLDRYFADFVQCSLYRSILLTKQATTISTSSCSNTDEENSVSAQRIRVIEIPIYKKTPCNSFLNSIQRIRQFQAVNPSNNNSVNSSTSSSSQYPLEIAAILEEYQVFLASKRLNCNQQQCATSLHESNFNQCNPQTKQQYQQFGLSDINFASSSQTPSAQLQCQLNENEIISNRNFPEGSQIREGDQQQQLSKETPADDSELRATAKTIQIDSTINNRKNQTDIRDPTDDSEILRQIVNTVVLKHQSKYFSYSVERKQQQQQHKQQFVQSMEQEEIQQQQQQQDQEQEYQSGLIVIGHSESFLNLISVADKSNLANRMMRMKNFCVFDTNLNRQAYKQYILSKINVEKQNRRLPLAFCFGFIESFQSTTTTTETKLPSSSSNQFNTSDLIHNNDAQLQNGIRLESQASTATPTIQTETEQCQQQQEQQKQTTCSNNKEKAAGKYDSNGRKQVYKNVSINTMDGVKLTASLTVIVEESSHCIVSVLQYEIDEDNLLRLTDIRGKSDTLEGGIIIPPLTSENRANSVNCNTTSGSTAAVPSQTLQMSQTGINNNNNITNTTTSAIAKRQSLKQSRAKLEKHRIQMYMKSLLEESTGESCHPSNAEYVQNSEHFISKFYPNMAFIDNTTNVPSAVSTAGAVTSPDTLKNNSIQGNNAKSTGASNPNHRKHNNNNIKLQGNSATAATARTNKAEITNGEPSSARMNSTGNEEDDLEKERYLEEQFKLFNPQIEESDEDDDGNKPPTSDENNPEEGNQQLQKSHQVKKTRKKRKQNQNQLEGSEIEATPTGHVIEKTTTKKQKVKNMKLDLNGLGETSKKLKKEVEPPNASSEQINITRNVVNHSEDQTQFKSLSSNLINPNPEQQQTQTVDATTMTTAANYPYSQAHLFKGTNNSCDNNSTLNQPHLQQQHQQPIYNVTQPSHQQQHMYYTQYMSQPTSTPTPQNGQNATHSHPVAATATATAPPQYAHFMNSQNPFLQQNHHHLNANNSNNPAALMYQGYSPQVTYSAYPMGGGYQMFSQYHHHPQQSMQINHHHQRSPSVAGLNAQSINQMFPPPLDLNAQHQITGNPQQQQQQQTQQQQQYVQTQAQINPLNEIPKGDLEKQIQLEKEPFNNAAQITEKVQLENQETTAAAAAAVAVAVASGGKIESIIAPKKRGRKPKDPQKLISAGTPATAAAAVQSETVQEVAPSKISKKQQVKQASQSNLENGTTKTTTNKQLPESEEKGIQQLNNPQQQLFDQAQSQQQFLQHQLQQQQQQQLYHQHQQHVSYPPTTLQQPQYQYHQQQPQPQISLQPQQLPQSYYQADFKQQQYHQYAVNGFGYQAALAQQNPHQQYL